MRLPAVFAGVVVAVACTQDFDEFQVVSGGSGTGGVIDGAGGSGGSGLDASAGSAGSPGGGAGEDGGSDAADVTCAEGQKACNGTCVNQDDPLYGCAAADCTPCNDQNATVACGTLGRCAITACDPGYEDCDEDPSTGCETNTQDGDANNCGGCNVPCSSVANATPDCAAGACTYTVCDQGFSDCDQNRTNGCEANVLQNPQTCGTCTQNCTQLGNNYECRNGNCQPSSCPIGLRDCDGNGSCETNIDTSNEHCGFCTNSCTTLPNAAGTCQAGQCVVVTCNANFGDCDETAAGCETNLLTDPDNCGACDRACSSANVSGAPLCENSVCSSSCAPGFGNCSQPLAPASDDGCEANTATDTQNCGACERACLNDGNVQTLACAGGLCTSTCRAASGTSNCGRPAAPAADDGCETHTATSPSHCGGCDQACSTNNMATVTCSAGTCVGTCASGFGDCNNNKRTDGCEISTATDVRHCGGCGRNCSTSNVMSLMCEAGMCTSTCLLGYANCITPVFGGQSDNGCELDVSSDDTDCGGCGNSCVAQSGQSCGANLDNICGCDSNSDCPGGQCNSTTRTCRCPVAPATFAQCAPGEYCIVTGATTAACSCNGGSPCAAGETCCNTPAGCFDLQTNRDHCGACGHACPPDFVCVTGSCRCSGNASCNAGTTGTFSCNGSGICVCNSNTCNAGRRCQPSGSCG